MSTTGCAGTGRRGPVLACTQAAVAYLLFYAAVAAELHLGHLSVAVLFAGAGMATAAAFAVNTVTDGHRGAGSCVSILAGAAGVVVTVLG